MSNPGELLAMLSVHGVRIGHIPGGVPHLTALDIAGALGMMHDKRGAAMLMAKYAQDGVALQASLDGWRMAVDREAYRGGWSHPDRCRALADYSLLEWIDAQRCRTCKGADVVIGNVKQSCPACEGTGLRKIGLRAPARALGMSAEGLRKSAWLGRVEWARKELATIEQRALSALAARIGRRS